MLGATLVCFAIASIAGMFGFNAFALGAMLLANVLLFVVLIQYGMERYGLRWKPVAKTSSR